MNKIKRQVVIGMIGSMICIYSVCAQGQDTNKTTKIEIQNQIPEPDPNKQQKLSDPKEIAIMGIGLVTDDSFIKKWFTLDEVNQGKTSAIALKSNGEDFYVSFVKDFNSGEWVKKTSSSKPSESVSRAQDKAIEGERKPEYILGSNPENKKPAKKKAGDAWSYPYEF